MNDINILNERGYKGSAAKLMAEKLSKVDSSLKTGVDSWYVAGVEKDFEISGIKLSELKSKFNLTYPAAILSMDWLIREPDKAKESFAKGVK